jgi:acyl-coenzyme A thioesterase PaaI-like protein
MGGIDTATVEAFRSQYRHCFGLHLDHFDVEDGEVVVEFVPRADYGGFDGVLHGGIVATALDEILAWAAILQEGVLVFTGTLDVRYRRMARIDRSYRLAGRVDSRSGRRLRISGRLVDGDGVVAEASGLYVVNDAVPVERR